MFGLDRIMGGMGIDLFSMMGLLDTGKDVLSYMNKRKFPDEYDTPEIIEKEIDGEKLFLIKYTIAYKNLEDAEEFVKTDEKLREIQKGFAEVLKKTKEKEDKKKK